MNLEQGKEIIIDGLVTGSGGRISRTSAETFGTVAHAIALAGGYALTEIEFRSLQRFRNLFTPTARGVNLDRLGADNHDTPVLGASAAVTSVAFTRTGPLVGTDPLEITAGTVLVTADGKRFTTDEDVSFAIGEAGPKSTTVRSLVFGPAMNVDPGAISRFEGSAPETGVTVTNAERAAGGNGRESPAQHRERIANRYRAAAKGIKLAIEDAALNVPQVRTADAYEFIASDGKPGGGGSLYVADKEGYSNATMVALVLDALNDARALGVWVDVYGAVAQEESISLSIEWSVGAATPLNRRLVREAVAAVVNTLRVRAAADLADVAEASKLTVGLVETGARAINGVEGVVVNVPTGTVVPSVGSVIRTRTSLIEVT